METAGGHLHEEAFEAVRRWWRAWVEKDLETIELMLSPDYLERDPTGNNPFVGPGELIRQATRYCDDCSITEWALDDPVAQELEHTVRCSYRFRISGMRGNRLFVYEGRATDVLTKKEGRWTFVSHDGKLEHSRPAG